MREGNVFSISVCPQGGGGALGIVNCLEKKIWGGGAKKVVGGGVGCTPLAVTQEDFLVIL